MDSDVSDKSNADGVISGTETMKLWKQESLAIFTCFEAKDIPTFDRTARATCNTISITRDYQSVYGSFEGEKDRNIEYRPNDFSFSRTGTLVHCCTSRTTRTVELDFSDEFLQSFSDHHGVAGFADESRSASVPFLNAPQHISLLEDFIQSGGFGGSLRAEGLATLILGDFFRTLHQKDTVRNATQCVMSTADVRIIQEYIDTHFDEKIKVPVLAQLVGVSPFHFSKIFKATTGLSPYQFVIDHRVMKAKALLLSTRLSLAEISYAVGFSSQSHMTTAFNKIVGTSPKRYRQHCS